MIDKLGFNEEEVKIVIKYQKEFPELLQIHKENGFVIDGRNLWEKLGKPHGDFSNWINRKIISKEYIENIDYKVYHNSVENLLGGRPLTEYTFTVDTAKHISLSENTIKGREIRNYFILMERAIRDMNDWLLIRHPEESGYIQLCKTLDSNYQLSHDSESTPGYVYSNEANMINRCLLGANAKKIRQMLSIDDDRIRNSFSTDINKALYEIQIMDLGLVMAGLEYEQRKSAIDKVCNSKYVYIRPIVEEIEKAI